MSTCCGKSASGVACDCPPDASCKTSVTEIDGKKVLVVEDSRATNKSELLERALTEDEARAQVCRSVAMMLTNSIEATEAELKKAKEAGQDGPAEQTGRLIVKAARELGVQLIRQARKLDRPLIMRPERSLKIARRH